MENKKMPENWYLKKSCLEISFRKEFESLSIFLLLNSVTRIVWKGLKINS